LTPRLSINLLAMGVPNAVVEDLVGPLRKRFGLPVRVSEPMPTPASYLNKKRGQFRSDLILGTLGNRLPPGTCALLALCDVDLFVPSLNFVFGQADPVRKVCIVSIIRLKQEFYGRPPDEHLLRSRTLKEGVHELGHLFGLYHCANPQCVMHFSNCLTDTDIKTDRFCLQCQRILARVMNTISSHNT
jgi:archaemetzincin